MIDLRICIDVPDVDRAIEFYRAAIGLELGRRLGQDMAEMLGAAVPIDLLGKPAGSKATPAAPATRAYTRHWTPVHLDVVVDDVDAAVARAQAAGATLEAGPNDHTWGRMANLADPFGNGLCLIELRGRGYDELVAPGNPAPA